MRRVLIPPALAAAALLLGSCASVPEELTEASALECPSGSACYDEPKPSGPGGSLEVTAGEFFFELQEVNAVEGEIEVTLENTGGAQHNFQIDEAYGEQKSIPFPELAPPGETVTGTLQLFAGEYTFYCAVPGHREQGMEGTLTVLPPGEAPAATEAPAAGPTGSPSPTEPVGQEGAATPGEPGASPPPSLAPGDTAPQGPPPVPQEDEPAGGG
jgi:uncharacterized cupredoxin-like copper-binding protein